MMNIYVHVPVRDLRLLEGAVAQLVKALDYKPKVAGSIPDGVNGIFR
jgi:hypothetical protein